MEAEENNILKIITENGEELEISPRGSLALLAFGAVGIDAWRKVRILNGERIIEYQKEKKNDQK